MSLVCFRAEYLTRDLNGLGLLDAGKLYVNIFSEWSNGCCVVLHFQFGRSTGHDGLSDLVRRGATTAGPAVLNYQRFVTDVLDLEEIGYGLTLFDLAKVMLFDIHLNGLLQFHLGHGGNGHKQGSGQDPDLFHGSFGLLKGLFFKQIYGSIPGGSSLRGAPDCSGYTELFGS